jgi:hypothetical protein
MREVRMPEVFVEKYFGSPRLTVKGSRCKKRQQRFLAGQLGVPPADVRVDFQGQVHLKNKAFKRLVTQPIEDNSFLEDGGRGAAVYEGVEMAYNDIMSGAVEASEGSLLEPVRNLGKKLIQATPAPARRIADKLAQNGAMEILTGVGSGLIAGFGLFLAYRGGRQFSQGLARGNADQLFNGSRQLFLGSEAIATGAALVGRTSGHPVVQTAAGVSARLATPFAVINGVVDLAQGTNHLKNAVRHADWLAGLEGVAELGMGAGWMAAAFGATPAIVTVSCACFAGKLGVALVRSRREKKRAEHERVTTAATVQAMTPQGEQHHSETELYYRNPPSSVNST